MQKENLRMHEECKSDAGAAAGAAAAAAEDSQPFAPCDVDAFMDLHPTDPSDDEESNKDEMDVEFVVLEGTEGSTVEIRMRQHPPLTKAEENHGRKQGTGKRVRHPSLWSISYEQLVNDDYGVAGMAKRIFGGKYPYITMRDVHRDIIVPRCQETGSSFALSLNPNGLIMDAFVTHCWDEPFDDFIETIRSSFQPYVNKPNLWICAFAILQGDRRKVQELLEVPLDESPFVRALRHASLYVVVRNSNTDLYSRIWCVCELLYAKRFGLTADNKDPQNKKTTWVIGPDDFSDKRTSCVDAHAYCAADKEKILKALEQDIEEIDNLVLQYRAHAAGRLSQPTQTGQRKCTSRTTIALWVLTILIGVGALCGLLISQPWHKTYAEQHCLESFNNDEAVCSLLLLGIPEGDTDECDCLSFCDGRLAHCVKFSESDNIPNVCPGKDSSTSPNVAGCKATAKKADLTLDASKLAPSTLYSLTNPTSPQSVAYQWLLQHPHLQNMSSERKLQLFGLASLYHSTKPWDTDALDKWLDYETDECLWIKENLTNGVWDFGATCDEEGHYQALDLDRDGLDGPLPPELFLLTHLSYISMMANNLRGSIPSEIGTLTKLTNLDLHENNLEGTLPTELGLLASLTYLGLWLNSIQGQFPSEFGSMTSLTFLSVHNNNLTGEIPSDDLVHLTDMNRLYLYDNRLVGTIPSSLCDNDWKPGITVDCVGGVECPCGRDVCFCL